jgi:hypothetical protein
LIRAPGRKEFLGGKIDVTEHAATPEPVDGQ